MPENQSQFSSTRRLNSTLSYLDSLASYLVWGKSFSPSINNSNNTMSHSSTTSPSKKSQNTGINIQHCPNCDSAYSAPLNCYHVVCEKQLGGCGTEFCFICAALRSPIMEHGNMMHRLSCPFNIDRQCCKNNCLQNGLRKCSGLQWKENCTECLKNERGDCCSFPINENPPNSGKHWKLLNVEQVDREVKLIQK